MSRRRDAVAWMVAAFFLLLGCASAPAGPPAVQWGSDECSHCHMILSEPRFAAVARNGVGEEARFDDLGCLADWLSSRAAGGWQVWVHASDGERWLAAGEAWLAPHAARTPMGSGLLAFADRALAARAAGESETPLSWPQLLDQRHSATHNAQPRGDSP